MRESSTTGKRLRAPENARFKPWTARLVAALIGVFVFIALPGSLGWAVRAVAAWDLAVLVLVFENWFVILSSDPERSRLRAAAQDPGRLALFAISLGASAISLLAAIVMISHSQIAAPGTPAWLRTALGLAAIFGAWTLLHTAFTLHYARLYYANPGTTNCIEFRGGPPDDADFAYFAFGVGMTFQPPDVVVTSRAMRRIVLVHEMISFGYNTAILALVVNLIAGQL